MKKETVILKTAERIKILGKILTFGILAAAASAAGNPLLEISDNKSHRLELQPGTQKMNAQLFLDNKTAGAIIPGSENWHLTDKGFTIAATIKLNRRRPNFGTGYGPDGKFLYDHDIIASKGDEFVFGRRSDRWSDQLYFNFKRNGQWSVPLVGTAAIPPYGTYAHVAITVTREDNSFRGQNGYIAVYYVNGEPMREQMINSFGPVTPSNDPWIIGSGKGVRNDHWSFGGELTDIHFYDRPLNDEEILALAVKSKPAQIAKSGGTPVEPALKKRFDEIAKTASPVGKWLLEALEQNVKNGASQKDTMQILNKNRTLFAIDSADKFADAWNKSAVSVKLYSKNGAILMLNTGKHSAGSPIAGWFDGKRNAEIFGNLRPGWILKAIRGTQPVKMDSASVSYELIPDPADFCKGTIIWHDPGKIKAVSEYRFDGKRLEMNLKMESLDPGFYLEEVTFPASRFRRLKKGTDHLLTPQMSGVVHDNPTNREIPQPWKNYPNGELNMQFHAYYDDLGGIYFAQEDPYAGNKNFVLRSRGGELEMLWTHPVSYMPAEKGGRRFELSGNGVWELFSGDWYDAGRIYRRFLADKAHWWIRELPRKSTPEWMRNNTLWILQLVFNEWDWYDTVANLKELRDYFELPFGLHYYEWFDLKKGSFPHFYTKSSALHTLVELKDAGIYLKPYTDNRTWSTMDGEMPGEEKKRYVFQFDPIAKVYAAKSKEGEMTLEGGRYRCAVMCPAVPEWQQFIYHMVERLAGHGFQAVYHDEVTTAQPIPCFDPNHGHPLNSPRNWLELGYWKMFEKIATLRKKYPDLCHDSEDASEPYMKYLDGVGPFRWTNPGQVPLFASIYAGRTQFNGRLYDHVKPGEAESFFDKMAVQIVNSEQMGWFTASFLNDPERRLYTKRLMHVRKMLLNYFNEGEMERRLKFRSPEPQRTVIWGALNKPERIVNPKVHHCVFRNKDGVRMILFVNSSPETVTISPIIPAEYGKVAACSGKNTAPEYLSGDTDLTIAPRETAVWVASEDPALLRVEAERISKDLHRIHNFTPGELAINRKMTPQKVPEGGVLHYSFDKYPVWHTQPAWRGLGCYELIGNPKQMRITNFNWALEPETEYEVSLAIRKDPGVKGLLRICNYDKSNKISHYAVIGKDVPADGVWHEVKVRFRTDAKLDRCGLYLYLEPTDKTMRIDEIKVRKVGGK